MLLMPPICRWRAAWMLPFLVAACRPGAGPAPAPAAGVATECVAPGGPRVGGQPFTVALTSAVDAGHAPRPASAGERLVFRQLYETLIRADCSGRALPGLAASWSAAEGGRVWTFTLRDDAAFWDGVPITARDVRGAWQAGAPGASPAGLMATAIGNRTLRVELTAPSPDPLLFADPRLAVAKPLRESPWPLGTAAYWVGDTTAQGMTLRPVAPGRVGASGAIAFRIAVGVDGRDILDAGDVDLLLSDDRAVLEYAATLAAFDLTPLLWDRTYVLLAPSRASGKAGGVAAPRFRAVLARDAVRADARGAEPPFWWAGPERCEASHTPTPPPAAGPARRPARPRIVFDRTDGVAWDLAARLVALGDAGASAEGVSVTSLIPALPERGVAAAGLPPEELSETLATGAELAYVLALPRRALGRCHEVAGLRRRTPWLGDADLGHAVVPLIDVRSWIIARPGAGRVTVDYDGTLRFVP